ncbi:MAG: hypothetical protein RID91_17550 [Azospirillaceae bacterium]
MTTHAELAGKLLRDAATFFRTVGDENPALKERLEESAATFENVATLVETDPTGELPEDDVAH